MAKAEWRINKKLTQDKLADSLQSAVPSEVTRPSRSFNADSDQLEAAPRRTVRNHRALDPLTEALGCDGFMMNAHFDWLAEDMETHRRALTVDRYYREMSLAIDLGQVPVSERDRALKKKLCSENGVTYYFVKNSSDVEKMVSESLYRQSQTQKARH